MDNRHWDLKAKQALVKLLEEYWILRETEPETYQLIRERESLLRPVLEEWGIRFIVHRHYAKVEKIPFNPESWMGIPRFETPQDYAMLFCLLHFLDDKETSDQFILSHAVEEIKSLYPPLQPIDWKNIAHRRSLVRVMKLAEDYRLIRAEEGNIHQYLLDDEVDVLYTVGSAARHFLRTFPKDITKISRKEQMVEADWELHTQDKKQKYRLLRQLLISPAIYGLEVSGTDMEYLRRVHDRWREMFDAYTDFRYELYDQAALLTLEESGSFQFTYPQEHTLSDIALQLSEHWREQIKEGNIRVQKDQCLLLSSYEFEKALQSVRKRYGIGWSKGYREQTLHRLAKEAIDWMSQWKIVKQEAETGEIRVFPLAGRIKGSYPAEFLKGREIHDGTEGISLDASPSGVD